MYKILGAWTFKSWVKEEESRKLNEDPERWEDNKKWIPLTLINVLFGPVLFPTPTGILTEVKGSLKNNLVDSVKRWHKIQIR